MSIASYGGEVVVRVPATFSARVEVQLRSRNGRANVRSDFDLTETYSSARGWTRPHRRYDELHATGTIGNGWHLIRIRAQDADVRIERI